MFCELVHFCTYLDEDGFLILHGLEELLLLVREPVVLVGIRPLQEINYNYKCGLNKHTDFQKFD